MLANEWVRFWLVQAAGLATVVYIQFYW